MKIVLAYSGGLDTLVPMFWIKGKYSAEMNTLSQAGH
jgi:argininosuccinate synthase